MSGTSHPFGKDWSADLYAALAPTRVLDIGAGNGGYARLFRPHHRAHWTALEIHEPYVHRYNLHHLYDQVIVGDARDGLPQADLIIAGDVIEHMPKDEGRAVLANACTQASTVLLSIPLGVYEQGPIDGNEHETHHATWTHDDVIDVLGDCKYRLGGPIGVYWWTSTSQS